MITSMRLKNFKAWKDTGEVQLAPVTLVLGCNSSGKSSLLQSLLLLKQTITSPDRSIHLNFGGDEANDFFNFGQFDDVLMQQASERQFTIEFTIKRQPGSEESPLHQIHEASFFAKYANSTGGTVVQESRLCSNQNEFRALRKDKGYFTIQANDEPIGTSRTYAPERSIAFPVEAIQALGLNGPLVQDISLAIRRELEGIAYLGPLRRKPERDYMWNKTIPGSIGVDGHRAIDALLASAQTKSRDIMPTDLIAEVSTWLERLGVAQKIEVKQIGHASRYKIMIEKDGIHSNLRDVGIGISQVLPVLILAHFAPSGTVVILEEPEIHLHPLAQAALAELFVHASSARNIQFIIETHSEHLFRRMQTLIAAQKATGLADANPDILMYFVEKSGPVANLQLLDVDTFGRVKNWPKDFFGDSLGETRTQTQLLLQRMKTGI